VARAAGDGVSTETRLPVEWDEERNVRWRTPLPDRGNSTPAVWGHRVFVTQAVEKDTGGQSCASTAATAGNSGSRA
jgi:hypothetical protein